MECSIFKETCRYFNPKLEEKFKRTEYEDGMMVTLILANLLCPRKMFNPPRYVLYCSNTVRLKCLCPQDFRMHFLSRPSFHTHSVSFIYMWCGGPLHPSTNPSLPDSSSNVLQCRTMAALSKMLIFLFYFNKVENGGYFPSCNSLD